MSNTIFSSVLTDSHLFIAPSNSSSLSHFYRLSGGTSLSCYPTTLSWFDLLRFLIFEYVKMTFSSVRGGFSAFLPMLTKIKGY